MSVSALVPSGAARAVTEPTRHDPVRASQHIFRIVLDALANPGTVRNTIVHPQVISEPLSLNPYLTSILVTVLDHEVSLHVVDDPDLSGLADFMVRRTRTALTDAEAATFVVAHATSMNADLPMRLRVGSLEYPDDAATLLVDVPSLAQDEHHSGELHLTLTGPGIATVQSLRVSSIDPGFVTSRNLANANYPMGIDMVLVDREGRVVGLPRTTNVSIHVEGAS